MRASSLLALALVACSPDPFLCPADPGGPVPTVDRVCAHVEAIGCFLDPDLADVGIAPDCRQGYEEVRAVTPPAELDRILRCYAGASDCVALEGCNRACGPDGGRITYRPEPDGGAPAEAGP